MLYIWNDYKIICQLSLNKKKEKKITIACRVTWGAEPRSSVSLPTPCHEGLTWNSGGDGKVGRDASLSASKPRLTHATLSPPKKCMACMWMCVFANMYMCVCCVGINVPSTQIDQNLKGRLHVSFRNISPLYSHLWKTWIFRKPLPSLSPYVENDTWHVAGAL